MSGEDRTPGGGWRMAALALAMVAALLLLARRLYSIQVEESRAYAKSQLRQSVRRVHIPAVRGKIFDRDGVCLADNRPSYCIALFIEDLRRPGAWSNTVAAVDGRINELSLRLGVPRQIGRREIEEHIYRQLPMPLLAWQDIDEKTLSRFSEIVTPNSGMDVYVQPERVYPEGAAFAHIVGRVGRDKPEAPTGEKSHYDILGMKGRDGVEGVRDAMLAGTAGGKLITVDVSGFRHSETNRPAVPGRDVRLAVSARLQRKAAELLKGMRGAIVAVDPSDGSILAMASAPTYDVSAMTPRVPLGYWRELLSDPETPLLNRAVSGIYPPGSIFKSAVALVALKHGVPDTFSVDCNGVFELGGMRLRCAARYGHGAGIDMRKAIEVSCNPYFCELGVHVGADAIVEFARELGLGEKTGIGLPGESAGLVPDDAWKRRVKREAWWQGDTANLSIGQGYLLVTPLQMALYTAALANGGTLFRPRLYLDDPVSVVRRIPIPAKDLAVVREGMLQVVKSPTGGGRKARVPGVDIAAKTGTAEYGSRRGRRKHAWMIAFAPAEAPEVALVVLVEDGESGGHTAAPLVSDFLREFFGATDVEDDEGNGGDAEPAAAEAPGSAAADSPAGADENPMDPQGDPAVQMEEAAP